MILKNLVKEDSVYRVFGYFLLWWQKIRAGISNSNFSEGQMWTYTVTQEPHYDADQTMAVPDLYC